MPSTVDNAPNTVSEAIALGIPLIAGRTGGTGELIDAEQRDDHMFGALPTSRCCRCRSSGSSPAPDARPLAELLRKRLTTPVEQARTLLSDAAADAAYDRWQLEPSRPPTGPPSRAPRRRPPRPTTPRQRCRRLAVCVLVDGDEAACSRPS